MTLIIIGCIEESNRYCSGVKEPQFEVLSLGREETGLGECYSSDTPFDIRHRHARTYIFLNTNWRILLYSSFFV